MTYNYVASVNTHAEYIIIDTSQFKAGLAGWARWAMAHPKIN